MSSTAATPRVRVIALPTLDELDELILEPVGRASEELESLASDLGNIGGDVDRTYEDVRFERPPTFAAIGEVMVFVDRLGAEVSYLERLRDDVRRDAMRVLDVLRVDGKVQAERPPARGAALEAVEQMSDLRRSIGEQLARLRRLDHDRGGLSVVEGGGNDASA